MSVRTDLVVTGMTCDHCVAAVRRELDALPGVTGVEVDLTSGAVTVTSTDPLAPEALAGAVDEAGYQVVAGEQDR